MLNSFRERAKQAACLPESIDFVEVGAYKKRHSNKEIIICFLSKHINRC